MFDISFTQNRELSWLRFNERVLDEAQDGQVPLLERMKFLSIFDSNLDEFFMVRVGSLTDLSMLHKRVIDNKSMMDQDEQLAAIMEQVRILYQKKDYVYEDLRDQCRAKGYYAIESEEMTEHEEKILRPYFENTVSPYLSYQIVDLTHPFPHIPNLGIVIVYRLRKKGDDDVSCMGIIQVPPNLNRTIRLDNNKYILLEKVIEKYGAGLFESYEVKDSFIMSVTRNADILVAAVGRAKLIKADMVKPGAVVIDVGMNRDENGKLCGDVDFSEVKAIAGSITPVPGGVGPMTIAMLMQNTALAAQMRRGISLS